MKDFVRIPEERLKVLRRRPELKKRIEELADVKIAINEEVEVEVDDSLKLMQAVTVVKAFGRGFDVDDALNLLDDSYMLEMVEIKDFSGKSENRMEALRGRVIGAGGKTKKNIEEITETKLAVYGKTVGIIGKWDCIEKAKEAVGMLLSGSSHNSVYRFLEQVKR